METAKNSSRTGLIVLVCAALALTGAISWAALRGHEMRGGIAKNEPIPAASAAANQPASLASLEARARAVPGDADAWLLLGQARFDAGLYAEAADAYDHGTQAAPGRSDLWSALGEARVMASKDSPMPAPALAAFRKAIAIDPQDPRGRYFLAVARDLGGDHAGAIGDWLALLRDTPPGAAWEQDLRRTIEQVGKIHDIDVAARLAAVKQPAAHPLVPDASTATAAIPGPSPADIRAAAALPPHEQDAMVQNMVAGLEAKLKADPGNLDGWIMLMRSRMTLGEPAKARAALMAASAANPGATARLRAEAATLGVR
jgi:cytochrome c-type biogenesis protein CcmH